MTGTTEAEGWELLYVLVVHPEQLPSWPNNSKQHKLI